MDEPKSYGYGKRPLWQWILLYVVIAGIAYGAVYFIFFNKSGGYTANSQYPISNSQTQNQTSNNTNQTSNKYMIQNMNVEVLQAGSGEAVKIGDQATMNYTGWLQDGTKFDSSLNPGRTPFQFTIGPNCVLDGTCVIEGWNLGVTGMKVGEKRKLTIPGDLAYGAAGRPPVIPSNATLIFEIELLKIN